MSLAPQFKATQEELSDAKEALQLLQQTSLRMKKEAAVEHQALQSRLSAAQVAALFTCMRGIALRSHVRRRPTAALCSAGRDRTAARRGGEREEAQGGGAGPADPAAPQRRPRPRGRAGPAGSRGSRRRWASPAAAAAVAAVGIDLREAAFMRNGSCDGAAWLLGKRPILDLGAVQGEGCAYRTRSSRSSNFILARRAGDASPVACGSPRSGVEGGNSVSSGAGRWRVELAMAYRKLRNGFGSAFCETKWPCP